MSVRVDGEVRRGREEGEVMLDDGVLEGEGGGGRGGRGEGRREEERSVEGDAVRGQGWGETRPLLGVKTVKVPLHPPLPVLLFPLFSPHPRLLQLLLPLLSRLPLHLLPFLHLSLPLRLPPPVTR